MIYESFVSQWKIDTDINSEINVHPDNGARIKFKQYIRELYYYGTTNMENNTTNNQVTNYTILKTIENNKSYFHIYGINVSE